MNFPKDELHEVYGAGIAFANPRRGCDPSARTAADAAGPTPSVHAEYLTTLYAPIAEAHDVDDRLRVVNHPDGWGEGLQIKGKIIPPSCDRLRHKSNGVNQLDVRLTI